MAGIPLSSGFDVSAGIALDLRTIKSNITERDNIPTVSRYEGLTVYVVSESKFYYLSGGTDNNNWTELSSSGVDQEQVEDIVGGMIYGFGNIVVTYDDNTGTITIDDTHNHDSLYVPLTRTINGKSLLSDITLNYSDVGAASSSHAHSISDITNLQVTLDSKVDTSDVVTTATANKILRLDSNAELPTSITGNAATATKLVTPRTFTVGDTSKSFDGSSDISWTLNEIGAASQLHIHSISDITNLQTGLDSKVNISDYTDVAVLGKIKNVDGAGSGLDADTLDGFDSDDFIHSRATNVYVRTNASSLELLASDGDVTGYWARSIKYGNGVNATNYGRIGAYGNSDSINYLYLIANGLAYDSPNALRVYPDRVTWGDSKIWHEGNLEKKPIYVTPSSGILSINNNGKYEAHYYTTISQNTTINISNLEDGSEGTIRLYLSGIYTITLGTMSLTGGSSLSKYLVGNLSSMESGRYVLSYKVYSTTILFTISTKFNAY